MIKNKKSQVFGIDLMAAAAMFTFAMIVFFGYIESMGFTSFSIEDFTAEAEKTTNIILSEGYPKNWTRDDVGRIGITIENTNEIDNSKLAKFSRLTEDSYTKTKSLISTKYDYYLCILNEQGTVVSHKNMGKPEITRKNLTSIDSEFIKNLEHLTKVDRFVIFDNKTSLMEFYLWEEK